MSFCGKIYKLDDNGMATVMGRTEEIKRILGSCPGFEWTDSESGRFPMGDAGITFFINWDAQQAVKSLDILITGKNHPYEFVNRFCEDNGWILHDLSSDGMTDSDKVTPLPARSFSSFAEVLQEAKVMGNASQLAAQAN